MSHDAMRIVPRFPAQRVLVIGESMLDRYLIGHSTRLCREAPAPIVDVEARRDAPGGAANTAANVAALGAQVTLLTALGADAEGDCLLAALEAQGVDTAEALRVPGRATLVKQRVVADPQLIVRFDEGSTDALDAAQEGELITRLRRLYSSCDAVIVSDYGYGILTPRVIEALADLQREAPRVLAVDAKDIERFRVTGATVMKPNFEEALRVLGGAHRSEDRAQTILAAAPQLFARTGAEHLAVTLDTDGALLLEPDGAWYRTYAAPAPNSRAAGAGDTFVAALALAFAAGASPQIATEVAAAAASCVVQRDGTTTCSSDDLCAALTGDHKIAADAEEMRVLVNAYRHAGRRVVLTGGCFDIVHRGHVTYLSQAKSLGDVLIVALNSDGSVRRLKGADRPVNPFEDRARVLEGLSCVDHVVQFDEDSPEELIRLLRPDVFVKGGDYTRETLPEAPLVEALGGTVEILPYIEGVSTTRLIEQLRAPAGAP